MIYSTIDADEALRVFNVVLALTVQRLVKDGLLDAEKGKAWAGHHAVVNLQRSIFAHVWAWFWPDSEGKDTITIVEVQP